MGKLRRIASMVAGVVAMCASALVVAPATAQAAIPVPCGNNVYACIDLSRQVTWLMDGRDHVTYGPVRITSGRPGYRTPVGVYKVLWKDRDHRSGEFNNAPMPYSVFFTRTGIAYHEGSLSQMSHGCIHLSHAAAVKFFNTLRVGQNVAVQP